MQGIQTLERQGPCDICTFLGLLRLKPVLIPGQLDAVAGETPDSLPVKWHCMTCFDTPLGHKSENVEHSRLPAAEYRVPYK